MSQLFEDEAISREQVRRHPMTIKNLHVAAQQITEWLQMDREYLELYHAYAQRFLPPGCHVHEKILEDALRYRGLTLDRLRAMVK